MMTQHDIEIQRLMASAWKENHERNQKLAKQLAEDRQKYASVDDAVQE